MSHDKNNPIPVLFENNHCMVFDKPAGLLVVPSPHHEKKTLESLVNAQYRKDQQPHLFPCHRLDRDTTGAILFAKGKEKQLRLMDLFRQRSVRKSYVGYVHGRMKRREGTLSTFVKSLEEERFFKNEAGKQAVTRYKVIQIKKGFSVVEFEPLTGRTNQIRIQFKAIGHPLLGERKYVIAKDFDLKFRRTALHATRIQWQDPFEHKAITVESPLPKDMKEFIQRHV
ncbi:MAG TPA: RluA family pseudouridine synthase [Candidatus Omnitrophota bacterium]|nr:RluA family pseudouridine synthase [Candidatus Omnitrophota bacterium]